MLYFQSICILYLIYVGGPYEVHPFTRINLLNPLKKGSRVIPINSYLVTHHTIVTAHRFIRTGQPKYLADKLVLRTPGPRHVNTISVNCDLTVSRSGFLYRAAKLWNILPSTFREELRPEAFKFNVRKWIRENVPRKPP